MARQQLSLDLGNRFAKVPSDKFGGTLFVGKQKRARPLDSRRPLHLSFKSSKAKGEWSLLKARNAALVRKNLNKYSQQFGVKVDRFANVGNHLHIVVRFVKPHLLRRFLRTFSAVLSRQITGARKGKPKGRFWTQIVFSRIVSWGPDYQNVCKYIGLNQVEAQSGSAARTFSATVESEVRALQRWFAAELKLWRSELSKAG